MRGISIRNALRALSVISSGESVFTSNGIFRSFTTVFMNTVSVAVEVRLNSSQDASNYFFSESSLNVMDVSAILQCF